MEAYTVYITKPAERDIVNAVHYIDEILHNPQAGDALLNAVEEAADSLALFPERFPLTGDAILAAGGIRWIGIKNYLALYTVDKHVHQIRIIRFLYAKSNWQDILKSDF